MEIRKASAKDIEESALAAGVRLDHLTQRGSHYLTTLKTEFDESGKVRWGRRSPRVRKDGTFARLPGPVCWHGHRAFMRELFTRCPQAVIISALAKYHGKEDFERTHGDTRYRRVGIWQAGNCGRFEAYVGELCDCANWEE